MRRFIIQLCVLLGLIASLAAAPRPEETTDRISTELSLENIEDSQTLNLRLGPLIHDVTRTETRLFKELNQPKENEWHNFFKKIKCVFRSCSNQ